MPVTVNQQNLVNNFKFFQKQADVSAVLKANAYGLGIENVAPVLAKQGCNQFFVAYVHEGIALRKLLPDITIYVLNGFDTQNISLFINYNLTPVCNTMAQISALPTSLNFVLQIETGMNRSGFAIDASLNKQPDLLISHLACAEVPQHLLNKQQLNNFRQAIHQLKPKQSSLAASYGSILGEDYHFDFCRIGIGLYGGIEQNNIKPVVEWSVPVLEVKDVRKGETVGYDATWIATNDCRIATLGVGYADGYPRALSNKGRVLINNILCPVVGRVSMDLVTADVTKVPQELPEQAILYGAHYTVNQAAEDAHTNSYEILTNLNNVR